MFKHKEKGQSLIELTFFLIILLILIAGIVEVGAILQTKLAVVNSAREGARFGTLSASDADITLVTQSAATNIINYDDASSDIWIIRAKTGDDGSIGDECPSASERAVKETYWCVAHTVGEGPETPDFVTKANIEDTLKGVSNTEVVGVAVAYDHQSIIGLPYAVGGGGMPVTSFTVMRVESTGDAALGCQVWPIGVPWDYVKDLNKGDLMKDTLEGPNKNKGMQANGGNHANFGWLSWNGEVNANQLQGCMQNPLEGSCLVYEKGSKQEEVCYENAADPEDTTLSVGDWVYNSTGWEQAAADEVDALKGRYIRIVVWDIARDEADEGASDYCHGTHCYYRVKGFAIIQITDWYDYKKDKVGEDGKVMNPSSKTIEAKFIQMDTSCAP